jgi:hypothetical protein
MNHSLAKIIRHLNHLTIKKKGANKNYGEVKDRLKALPQIKLNMQTYRYHVYMNSCPYDL